MEMKNPAREGGEGIRTLFLYNIEKIQIFIVISFFFFWLPFFVCFFVLVFLFVFSRFLKLFKLKSPPST